MCPADLALARRHIEGAADGQPGTRERILRFLDDHPDALWRSCAEGHLTGSAAVVQPGGPHVLVLLHTKVGRWLQPGGHADGDGDLAAVALREATEETGIDGLRVVRPAIDLDVHTFVAPGEPTHLHLDARFLVVAPAGAEPRGNEESRALRWATPTELIGLGADAGLLRLAHRAVDLALRL
jgi:8-oxo-dGTP pyrophosphatase MutT (NUDIX family)